MNQFVDKNTNSGEEKDDDDGNDDLRKQSMKLEN